MGSRGWASGARQRTTHSRLREVSEGSIRRSFRKPTKLRSFSPPRAKSASKVAADRPEAGNAPSSARPLEARMTARWSGVARGNAYAKSVRSPTGDLEVERRRVSHGARRRSSKGDVCHGCSWRETSVVETSSRHLGAVIEGWPQGRTRHGVERRRRPVARNGAVGHGPSQKGATGRQKPKGGCRPLGDGLANKLIQYRA